MSFDTILFDLDGTLTDSAPGIINSVKYALNKLNIEIPPYNVLEKFIGPPLIDSFKNVCGIKDDTITTAVMYFREYFEEKGLYENSVYEGVPELLETLYSKGKKIILATSKPEKFAVIILKHFDLYKYFSEICGATLDEKRTLKNEVIEYTLKKANVNNFDNVVMVGDRHHDIDGARLNNIKSIGVLYGFGDYKELSNARADFIVNDTKELLNVLI